jgi:type VI secretion system protein VasD
VRIYHLKQSASFQQAFYGVFLDADKEKETFSMDVISKKEITLIPGQAYNNVEKVNLAAESIGVVAFFQRPAASRWKLTFPVKNIEKEGLSLNLDGCSMIVLSGNTLEFGAAQQSTLKTPASCI